jgi:hypothetical protein
MAENEDPTVDAVAESDRDRAARARARAALDSIGNVDTDADLVAAVREARRHAPRDRSTKPTQAGG